MVMGASLPRDLSGLRFLSPLLVSMISLIPVVPELVTGGSFTKNLQFQLRVMAVGILYTEAIVVWKCVSYNLPSEWSLEEMEDDFSTLSP